MAKNKAQKSKQKKEKAFTVRSGKKSKTKAVVTNLKKIQLQNKNKTEQADKSLKALHDTLIESAKSSKDKPSKKVYQKQKHSKPADFPDVDMTAESLSKI